MTRRDFEKIIKDDLKKLSYINKKSWFIKNIDDNNIGTIGFGVASHRVKGSIFVAPTIGVLNKQVEELYFKLTGSDTLKLFQPTICKHIGYLMPENTFIEWNYNNDSNFDDNNLEIIKKIEKYGIPFIEKYSNQDELLKCIEERKYILNEYRDYKLPLLYFLRGEKQKGLETIEATLERRKKPKTESDFPSLGGETILTIIGSGYKGVIDQRYLNFIDMYKAL